MKCHVKILKPNETRVCWSSVQARQSDANLPRMRIFVLRSRARARHTSCFWPTLERNIRGSMAESHLQQEHLVDSSATLLNRPIPEVPTALRALVLQLRGQRRDEVPQVREAQRVPHVGVRVARERVQVEANGARKQDRVLSEMHKSVRGLLSALMGTQPTFWD